MYTGSRLFWGWSVDFWGSSPASFPLLSSLNKEGFLLLFSMAHILHTIVGHPAFPQDLQLVIPSIPAVELLHRK